MAIKLSKELILDDVEEVNLLFLMILVVHQFYKYNFQQLLNGICKYALELMQITSARLWENKVILLSLFDGHD
jgi:hypothetical protein